MAKSPIIYLSHIINSANDITSHIAGISKESFIKDVKTQDAVIRKLEIIGEASNHLEEQFTKSHPEIPWSQVVGFRNKLIHAYWEIDLDIVWKAATEDVIFLRDSLLPVFHDLEQKESNTQTNR